MKYSRKHLKQLIIQEMCGPGHGEHMPNGDMGSAAIQHPTDISKGDMSGHGDDHEGKMALSQLGQIMQNADALQGIVSLDDNLQAWVQSKLTKAADYLDTVKKYMEFESTPGMPVGISLGEHKVQVSKIELKQMIKEMLLVEGEPEYEFYDQEGVLAPIPGGGQIGLDPVSSTDPTLGYRVAPHHSRWHKQNPGNPTYYRRAAAPAPAPSPETPEGISDTEMIKKWGRPKK